MGLWWIGLTVIGPYGSAWADIWYVDNEAGQDTNSGRTQQVGPLAAGPFRTISRALRAANIGDSIVLAKNPTPYREVLTFSGPRHSGFADRPFRLVGNGATLSGTREILPEQWRSVGADIYECRPVDGAYQQLYIGDRPATYQAVTRDTVSELEPLAWSLVEGKIYFRTDANRLPQNYPLQYAADQTGITLYLVEHVSLENLVVQGFWQDGVNAHDNVRHTKLIGLTVRGNGRSGISVGGCSRLDVVSSLIGDNWWHQVRTEGLGRMRLMGSHVLPNGQGETKQQDGGDIQEDQPVVTAPIIRRLRVEPVRQASPGSVMERAGQPTRTSRLPSEGSLYR
jgi:hypothetical protein